MAEQFAQVADALPFDPKNPTADWGAGGYVFTWLAQSGQDAPPYWSQARDLWLRDFWRRVDPLKVAVNTFASKASTIPIAVRPRDRLVKRHADQAARFQADLMRNSQVLKGWKVFFKKFLTDYLTQDNGAFAIIMGRGAADGPILGAPYGLYHLDSLRCIRTGDPEYPVRYLHTDNRYYKLHYTRVITIAALPSPDAELNDVGFCPISYTLDAATELQDVYTYSREKFGSRPQRQVLYAKKGATIDQLRSAVAAADEKLSSDGLTRFAKTLLIAPKLATQELELATLDLTSAPDNFNRMDVTILDMAMIASSFGLDLRDLAIAFGVAGQTKSDAEVQDRKGRGKGVGEFLEALTDQMNYKYLPKHLEMSFDNLDDAQDEQQAMIRNTRSQARERDLRAGVTTIRVERELMLRYNEITVEEFEEMELLDGRLPNGLDVLLLFATQDTEIAAWLDLGVDDPTLVEENDAEEILSAIHEAIIVVSEEIDSATNATTARKARQALAALEKLQALYRGQQQAEEAEAEQQRMAAMMGQADPNNPQGDPANPEEDAAAGVAEDDLTAAGSDQPGEEMGGATEQESETKEKFAPRSDGKPLPRPAFPAQGQAEISAALRGRAGWRRLLRGPGRSQAKHRGR